MSVNHGVSDIEALVREEKRLTAVESHSEAWAETLSAGIEPEIVAEAALATALAESLRTAGENATLVLIDKMRERILAGDFEPVRTRH
ncbi:MAG TPA: hypothetical protein VIU14_15985 [Mesorhizobium sp.]|jgi:hypothetical protein